MKRDSVTGLILPNTVADNAERRRNARNFYSFNCNTCGYHQSFKTKEECKADKKAHKRNGCAMMLAVAPDGTRRMMRRQLYSKLKEAYRRELADAKGY